MEARQNEREDIRREAEGSRRNNIVRETLPEREEERSTRETDR